MPGDLLSSLRQTIRRLSRSGVFTAIVVLTLALGVGANTAIFSVINGVLLKPLPYPDSERLIALWMTAPGVKIDDLNMSPSVYFVLNDEARTFDGVSLWTGGTSSVTGIAEPEEVPVIYATNKLLPTLGVKPAIGRPFTAADDQPSGNRTVMLSNGYWKARFRGRSFRPWAAPAPVRGSARSDRRIACQLRVYGSPDFDGDSAAIQSQ